MRIVWLDEAFDDLERLSAFLRPKNPAAANRIFDEVRAAVQILTDFPNIGRLAPTVGSSFRELLVPFSSSGCVVLYVVAGEILIVRVRHQREDDYPAPRPHP